MRKSALFACLMAFSVGAFAVTDCTKMNPMQAGRPTLVVDAPSNGGKEALLGCNDGYTGLAIPGMGSFSWSAVQAPDFFLLLWRDKIDEDRNRLKRILGCWDQYEACRKASDSILSAGQTACAQAKVTIGSSWSADGSGGSVGSSISLERAAPSEYGRCTGELGIEIMKMRTECTAIAQRCNDL